MLSKFENKNVVIDTEASLTYVGCLVKFDDYSLYLEQATLLDASTSRIPVDQFLVECASFEPSSTRKSIWIFRAKVISISLLSDIIIPGH